MYHDSIEDVNVGKHPQVSAFLTGMFNNRFPQPKYQFIWDVEKVVTYISSLDNNEDLDDQALTKNLTMLLALASTARAHEICYLDIRFLVRHHSGYTFSFAKPTKVSRKGKLRPPITFTPFEGNSKLCVCKCMDTYPLRSKYWREYRNHLLLSYVRPHKEISKKTISRWITNILKLSGIDTSIFFWSLH